MNMKIIDNLSPNSNHDARIRELLKAASSVVIVSPFLMPDIGAFLSSCEMPNLIELQLITTLVSNSKDQLKKVKSLKSLIDWSPIASEKVACTISINNRLHGKVYVFSKDGNDAVAIITSANFTEHGLMHKHEWGTETDDAPMIAQLDQALQDSCEIASVTAAEVNAMYAKVLAYEAAHPEKEKQTIELDVTQAIAPRVVTEEFDRSVSYFLKPIGATETPVQPTEMFNGNTLRIHFSKRKPRAVHKGDVIIAYGVGTTKVLSIYRATNEPTFINASALAKEPGLNRWPWYVWGENVTPNFGGSWDQHDLKIGKILKEFIELYPGVAVTSAGSQSLGALMRGQDKLRLSFEFAEFLVEKIKNH